jgi:hypothetical protein
LANPRASLTPERRYIEYESPEEYLCAIYERLDAPADPWRDLLGRDEEDAKDEGAELPGEPHPGGDVEDAGRRVPSAAS